MRALLDAGADKDHAANDGCTPLYIAAQNGHDAVVRTLLDAGADNDLATNDGATPLFMAAQEGHATIVRALLGAGADKTRLYRGQAASYYAETDEIRSLLS